jgi:hypothetical protein
MSISEDGITMILNEESQSGLLSSASKVEVHRASNVEFDNVKGCWYFDTTPVVEHWMKTNWKPVQCPVCEGEPRRVYVNNHRDKLPQFEDFRCDDCNGTGYKNWQDTMKPERFDGFATRQEALDAEVEWLEEFLRKN